MIGMSITQFPYVVTVHYHLPHRLQSSTVLLVSQKWLQIVEYFLQVGFPCCFDQQFWR